MTGARQKCVVYMQDKGDIRSGYTGGDTGRIQSLVKTSEQMAQNVAANVKKSIDAV